MITSSHKVRIQWAAAAVLCACAAAACSTMPEPKVTKYAWPEGEAFIGEPKDEKGAKREYTVLGQVRTKVNYASLDPNHEEGYLCKNYFNKAIRDLVARAKKRGADAVIDVKSITFMVDGRWETHTTAECADDGEEGQVLAQGIAVNWRKLDPEPGAAKAPGAMTAPVAPAKANKPVQAAEIKPRRVKPLPQLEPEEPQDTMSGDEEKRIERHSESVVPRPDRPVTSDRAK